MMYVAVVSGSAFCASLPVRSAFAYAVVCGIRVKLWFLERVATPPVCCFVFGSSGLSVACWLCVRQSLVKVAAWALSRECSCIWMWSAVDSSKVVRWVCAFVTFMDWMV